MKIKNDHWNRPPDPGSLLNDYVQSASESDGSEPTPLIVFTPEEDTTDWKNDGE